MKLTNEQLGAIIFERFEAHGLAHGAMRDLEKTDVGGAFYDAMIHAIAADRELPPNWETDFDESDNLEGQIAADEANKTGRADAECMQAFFRTRRAHMIFRKLGI
jgi:hypothetical protein